MTVSIELLRSSIDRQWRASITATLRAYVGIPSLSPAFDPQWQAHGHIAAAMRLLAHWCRVQQIPGIRVEVCEVAGCTPLLLVEIPGQLDGSVLIYGHLDKQPEMVGWSAGLGPWQPVERNGKLYGRGSADDGYAVFSALASLVALHEQHVPVPRCLVLIEASEESGSIHLGAHLEALGARLGEPSLIICLDAECGNYEQLWSTTSLRGCVDGLLHVQVLSTAAHSGFAGGIVPTPLQIATQLLMRLEDAATGRLRLNELRSSVPLERREQIAAAARVLGQSVAAKVPLLGGVRCLASDPAVLLESNCWSAALAVTGADGLPPTATAANVVLPQVTLRLSCRLPPAVDAMGAADALRTQLERHPPYAAHVRFEVTDALSGWNAPPLAPWLDRSLQQASKQIFGADAIHLGCGGTIPFLPLLGRRFPDAQFLATGVLGPGSNAHGPDEFLHLDYVRKLTCCLALVIADSGAAYA